LASLCGPGHPTSWGAGDAVVRPGDGSRCPVALIAPVFWRALNPVAPGSVLVGSSSGAQWNRS
jgi:hypothetical protein